MHFEIIYPNNHSLHDHEFYAPKKNVIYQISYMKLLGNASHLALLYIS